MALMAGHTTYSRSSKLEKSLPLAIASIASESVLLLIPSILIGNAMNVSSLAIDRYRSEINYTFTTPGTIIFSP